MIDKSYLKSDPLKFEFLLPLLLLGSPKSLKKSSKISENDDEKSKFSKPPCLPPPFSKAA